MIAGDLVLLTMTVAGPRNMFRKYEEAFEIKDLYVNLGKAKVMFIGYIIKDGLSRNKISPCYVCSM